MTFSTAIRREKMFGEGRPRPLDRNAKVRIMVLARALSHRTEKGKAYGKLTAKFLAVLESLLWGFHNAATGRCFPSYDSIAERARCAYSTVAKAIQALERVGILTWVNRIARVREWSPERDLYGQPTRRVRVLRTSNAYTFNDPKPPPNSSTSDSWTGTPNQDLKLTSREQNAPLETALDAALLRLGQAIKAKEGLSNGESANTAP